jgi:hypothetical protein
MNTKSNQKRPEYTLEFKQDAAKLVNEKVYTHQKAADSLGISLSAIGRWVRAKRGMATVSTTKKPFYRLMTKLNWYGCVRKMSGYGWSASEILIPTRGTRKGHSLLC